MEVWRGTHQLTVLGHIGRARGQQQRRVNPFRRLEVGGHEWHILYYPSGFNDEHVEHVTVFLLVATPIDHDVVLEVWRLHW